VILFGVYDYGSLDGLINCEMLLFQLVVIRRKWNLVHWSNWYQPLCV